METDQFAMYDLLDVIIESLTPDQLNEIEDVIVNHTEKTNVNDPQTTY